MKCVFHEAYRLNLPAGHPFPMGKYPLLKERLMAESVLQDRDVFKPELPSREMLELVHTADYLDQLEAGALSAADLRRLGIPWSEGLWLRARLACAGTLLAARFALTDGMAANLAGGTHHAFSDHAEGFCILNDVAVAIRVLMHEGHVRRALIIDLDVHQGNGTAVIFADTPEVFTLSMHGEKNYPVQKMRSSLDVELPDGTQDLQYLETLRRVLPAALQEARADIAFYIAGVDVAAGDRYGRLALSEEGIRMRDRFVIDATRAGRLPLTIVLGGGYAYDAARTAELHAQVFREAVNYELTQSRSSSL